RCRSRSWRGSSRPSQSPSATRTAGSCSPRSSARSGGDICLLLPRGFVAGLLHFLVAHLLYTAAFARGAAWSASAWALLAPFALGSLAMLRYLWPHLGRDRAPVGVYVSVIA